MFKHTMQEVVIVTVGIPLMWGTVIAMTGAVVVYTVIKRRIQRG